VLISSYQSQAVDLTGGDGKAAASKKEDARSWNRRFFELLRSQQECMERYRETFAPSSCSFNSPLSPVGSIGSITNACFRRDSEALASVKPEPMDTDAPPPSAPPAAPSIVVQVAGEPVPLEDISSEHKQRMTAEEYEVRKQCFVISLLSLPCGQQYLARLSLIAAQAYFEVVTRTLRQHAGALQDSVVG
jgi:hypothetical protein